MTIPKKVFIRELGPREGFQTLRQTVASREKLELIDLLTTSGVQEVEITSLVRPDAVPQMADAEEVIATYQKRENVRCTALYLNQKGFERGEKTGRLENQGWIYSATSATFLAKNNNTTQQKIVDAIPEWLQLFQRHSKKLHGVMISTAFGCGYEGKEVRAQLMPVLRKIIAAIEQQGSAVEELSLADTVGLGDPETVRRAIATIRTEYPNLTLSLHLHDTRGTAIANAYAGLCEGVSIFDASVAGLGGCPFTPGAAGNVATEDLVYLCEELGAATGISLPVYAQAARLAERIVGHPLPGKTARTLS